MARMAKMINTSTGFDTDFEHLLFLADKAVHEAATINEIKEFNQFLSVWINRQN